MQPASEPIDVIIYHNPECGTSRNTLGLIRNAGIEPHVIEYLKIPPSRVLLRSLIERMGASARDVLDDPSVTEDQLLDAMTAHPILINRPIVVAPLGVKLCRPSEVVLDLLPAPQRGEYRKEDGQLVVDGAGQRVL
jgi:arsenate reductase